MRVLLVQPPVSGLTVKNRIVEPLALEILAATIIDCHDVKILDLRVEDRFEEEFFQESSSYFLFSQVKPSQTTHADH